MCCQRGCIIYGDCNVTLNDGQLTSTNDGNLLINGKITYERALAQVDGVTLYSIANGCCHFI